MGKVKATNAGSCQACGRIQKAPGGYLALHGYTVEWNCFNGQCPGSKHIPYEHDCSLIQRFVNSAQEQHDSLKARIAELNAPATEPKAWVSEYIPATWQNRHSRYQDRNVTLFSYVKKYEHTGEEYLDIWYFNLEGKFKSLHTHSIFAKTVLEAATQLNQRYASNELEPRLKQLKSYIDWQNRRIREWKYTDLLPLESVR